MATKVVGWGPFRIPGEARRSRRAHETAVKLVALAEWAPDEPTATTGHVDENDPSVGSAITELRDIVGRIVDRALPTEVGADPREPRQPGRHAGTSRPDRPRAAEAPARADAEVVPAAGEPAVFRSMRSGWLRGDDVEFGEIDVDRGWEYAGPEVDVPLAEAAVAGLPRRAPGERLIPGSAGGATPPTASKARDPEAIRRRLQAHTAGVSRGRQAADRDARSDAGSSA